MEFTSITHYVAELMFAYDNRAAKFTDCEMRLVELLKFALTGKEWDCFVLRYNYFYSFNKIACAMDMSARGVRRTLSSARKKMFDLRKSSLIFKEFERNVIL